MLQFADQFRIILISQLIKDISRVPQKLPRYFKYTAISTSAVPSSSALFVNLNLNLNDLESVMLSSRSSLQYF